MGKKKALQLRILPLFSKNTIEKALPEKEYFQIYLKMGQMLKNLHV